MASTKLVWKEIPAIDNDGVVRVEFVGLSRFMAPHLEITDDAGTTVTQRLSFAEATEVASTSAA